MAQEFAPLPARLGLAINGCGAEAALTRIETPDALIEAGSAADSRDEALLILASGAETGAGVAIRHGLAPGEALALWAASLSGLLAFCRRNRRRATLIDAGALIASPALAFDALAGHLGLQVPADLTLDMTGIPAPDALSAVLARQGLAETPEVRKLASEFAALAVPLGRPVVEVDDAFEAVVAARRKLEQAGQHSAALSETVTRLEAGLASAETTLAGFSGERETARREAEVWKAAHDLLRQQMAALQSEASASHVAARDGKGLAQGLQARIHALDARSTALERQGTALESRNTALERQNTALQGRNTALERQNTALQGRNTALERQNTALQGQNAALEKQNAALRAALEQSAQRGDETLAQARQARADLAAAETEIHELRAMITALHGSTSWRITKPLRTVKLKFVAAPSREEPRD